MTKIGIRLGERAREIEALKHISDDIQDQSNRVQDEDWRLALVGFGKQQESYQKYEGGSKLGSIVDADLNAVENKFVDLDDREAKRGAILK